MEELYTVSKKKRLGADFGPDHELIIGKFRLKLKKVGKTTTPFRYDLNQIPYDYIAKSLQLCPTLCNPIDGSPPGSPVPRILQARTLE